MSWSRRSLTSFAATSALSAPAWTQCSYSVVVVQRPANWLSLSLYDMNEGGVVAGSFTTQAAAPNSLPFRWTLKGGFEPLPMPPGTFDVNPEAISDSGIIIGKGFHAALEPTYHSVEQLVQWTEEGVMTPTPTIPPSSCQVQDVNSSGLAVGYYSTGPLSDTSFLWDGTSFNAVASELMQGFCYTHAVNDCGDYAGLHKLTPGEEGAAFIASSRGEVTKLMSPVGLYNLRFRDLNESRHGPLQGTTFSKTGYPTYLAYYWTGSELQPIPAPEGHKSVSAWRCNDFDQLIGTCVPLSGFSIMPFVWQDGVMTDLRTLMVLPRGVNIVQLFAITNAGAILARGLKGGQEYLLLLTPETVDEDVNHDCRIDMRDLVAMLDAWSNPASPIYGHADVNHDGTVNGQDLGAILGAWTPSDPAPRRQRLAVTSPASP